MLAVPRSEEQNIKTVLEVTEKNEGSIKTVLKIPGESSERSTKSMLEVTEKMLVYSTPSGNVAEDTFVSDLFHRSEAKAQWFVRCGDNETSFRGDEGVYIYVLYI